MGKLAQTQEAVVQGGEPVRLALVPVMGRFSSDKIPAGTGWEGTLSPIVKSEDNK